MKENEDPKPGSAPEPVAQPKPVEDKVMFSYRELELTDVVTIDGYRYLFFIVRGEYVVSFREFDYYNWLSYIFQEIEFITEDGGTCICDECSPACEVVQEDYKIIAQKVDLSTEEIVETHDKFIKVYSCFDLITHTVVGIHESHEDSEIIPEEPKKD